MIEREGRAVSSPGRRQAHQAQAGPASCTTNRKGNDITVITQTSPRVIRLWVVNPDARTSNPGDVTTLGLAELEIYGRKAAISAVRYATFGSDQLCTSPALAEAVTWPEPADVYVTYDLSRTQELVQSDVTGFSSWIGVGRLLIQLGHDLVDRGPEAVALELGLGQKLVLVRTDVTAASRAAVATALLATLLYGQMEMNPMLHLSRGKTRPFRSLPDRDDAAGWAAVPRDDLDWVVQQQAGRELAGLGPDPAFNNDVTHRALRELNRRRIFTYRS